MLTARWQLDFFIVVVLFARCQHCLDNGLALTPPLGWITTERFECLVDCANYPDDCIRLVHMLINFFISAPLSGYNAMRCNMTECGTAPHNTHTPHITINGRIIDL